MRYGTLILLAMLFLSGCATMDAVRPKHEATRVYDYPLDAVFAAAKTATKDLGLDVVEESPDKTFLTAKRGMTLWSYGEVVGVYFVPNSTSETEVTVRNVRRLATNITATDFSWKIHRALPPLLAKYSGPNTAVLVSRPTVSPNLPVPSRDISPRPAPFMVGKNGRQHALVIGNNNYRSLPKLVTAVSDAKEVASVLQDEYGFSTKLLLDADRASILRALRKYRSLPDTDNLLIYYAGHGWLDRQADEGYWLPTDAVQNDNVNWIPNSTITAEVRALQAKHVMVVADSCYSGKLTRGLQVAERTPGYYQRLAERKARVVLSSGGLELVTDSGGQGNHSVFASALLDVLIKNSGLLDGVGLFSRIREKVGWNADQIPEYGVIHKAGHDGGDFIFRRISSADRQPNQQVHRTQ